jgi:hypothetical protein
MPARLAGELLHQLCIEVAHAYQQCDDRSHQRRDAALGDHVRDELLDRVQIGSERAGDRRRLVARGGHRDIPIA